jgi:hypothetical protein
MAATALLSAEPYQRLIRDEGRHAVFTTPLYTGGIGFDSLVCFGVLPSDKPPLLRLSLFIILSCVKVTRQGFDLNVEFIDHFNT